MSRSLRLDPIRCDGFGLCAEVLPELVSLDDWGYPIVDPSPIPARLLDRARRAVDVCPVLAMRLQAVLSEETSSSEARRRGAHLADAAANGRTRVA